MQKIVTQQPCELPAMDLLMLEPSNGFGVCLVAMDHHTKWLSTVPLRSKTAQAVATAMERHLSPHLLSPLVRILTDNGPEFAGKEFNEMLHRYGITHQYTTPNKPSSNGLIERANRTLLELLRVES